jgi:hypothetical protein
LFQSWDGSGTERAASTAGRKSTSFKSDLNANSGPSSIFNFHRTADLFMAKFVYPSLWTRCTVYMTPRVRLLTDSAPSASNRESVLIESKESSESCHDRDNRNGIWGVIRVSEMTFLGKVYGEATWLWRSRKIAVAVSMWHVYFLVTMSPSNSRSIAKFVVACVREGKS